MPRRQALTRIAVPLAVVSAVTLVTASSPTFADPGAAAGAAPALAGAAPAVAGPLGAHHARPKSCVTITGTEYVNDMDFRDADPAGPSVGDVGIYKDTLVGEDGKVIATLRGSGRITHARPTDGHLITYYDDEYRFPDGGRVRAIGSSDVNAVIAGVPAVQAIHGVGGRYDDFYGSREWVRTSGEEATVTMTLCPDTAPPGVR